MYYYTYLVIPTNKKSSLFGKVYFGQRQSKLPPEEDIQYKGSGKKIREYLKQYPNDYYKEIIKVYFSEEELNKAEYNLIHPHLNKDYCLNLCEGGLQFAGFTGHNHTDESKEKCRIGSLGNKNASGKRTTEQIENIKAGCKKRKPESYIYQSISLKQTLSDPNKKLEMSVITKHLWEDIEFRNKVLESRKQYNATHTVSVETRNKKRESMKGKNKGKHKVWDNKELNIYHFEY